ncbi:MAG: ATP synthase F1 subunit delta [bacterium]|nr:ATP synthase F1 subunit delta [bacterium]
MRNAAIARVYATALLELGGERNQLEELTRDLDALREIAGEDIGFVKMLESPELGFDQKRRILEKVVASAETELTLRFLLLLVRKHREAALYSIIEMFHQLRDEKEGRLRGRLRAARGLESARVAELEAALSRSSKATVLLDVEQDEELMAGMVLHLADLTVDGSLKMRLSRMKDRLLSAEMGKE